VNRSTGRRAIVSDYGDLTQGPSPDSTHALAVEKSGQILVAGNSSDHGAVFRVDPSTGVRTRLSDFGNPTQLVFDLTVAPSGDILTVGWGGTDDTPVTRVDPETGTRTLVFDVQACFPRHTYPGSLAVEESGTIIVLTGEELKWPHRLDPTTGVCTGLPAGGYSSDVTIVPTPLVNDHVSLSVSSTALDPTVGPAAPAGVFRITAALTNLSSLPLRNPFFRVIELSGDNVLVSQDGRSEVIQVSSKGARQTPDVGPDGVLSPGESVIVEFAVGLQSRERFTFFVNVFGEPDASGAFQ
jgi:hypothetical protein